MAALKYLLLFLAPLFIGAGYGPTNTVVVGIEDVLLPETSDEGLILLNRFAKDKNQVFQYRILPIERLFKELFRGRIHVKYPDNPNWKKGERSEVSTYFSHKPLWVVNVGFIRRKADPSPIRKVGAILGFTVPQVSPNQEIIYVRNFASLRFLLKSKRVDAVYANLEMFLQRTQENSEYEYSKNSPLYTEQYFASTTTAQDLLLSLDLWMKENSK